MLIYIAGPYTAETEEGIIANIRAAEEIGKQVLLRGFVPVIPHKNTALWDKDERFKDWGHADWIERVCFPLLRSCDALLLMPNWETSKGAVMEYNYAREHRMLVFHSLQALPGIEYGYLSWAK